MTISNNNISFAVGTGRCGTTFLAKLMKKESSISSVHERNPLNETFHRYCKWYGLPIDHEGFLDTKRREIQEDLKHFSFSFESSALLSLSIEELYQDFNAKFILMIRSPDKVINSYIRKGWYEKPIIRLNKDLPPSFQECSQFYHFLGRIIPSGDDYLRWNSLTRVGKLAWYWNTLNESVLKQFDKIPKSNWRIQKLEKFSYDNYLELAEFIGFKSTISEAYFNHISKIRPNSLDNIRSITSWNDLEIQEFEQEVHPIANIFGYEDRFTELISNIENDIKFSNFHSQFNNYSIHKVINNLKKFVLKVYRNKRHKK